MTQAQVYFDKVWGLCLQASADCGIKPEVIFSQSALETGYGAHDPQNNYFGIKGPGGQQMTTEFVGGHPVKKYQAFEGYATMADSFHGYAVFILANERYNLARAATTARQQLADIASAGYATDPDYFNKVSGVMATVPTLLQAYYSIVGKLRRDLSPKPPAPVPVTPSDYAKATSDKSDTHQSAVASAKAGTKEPPMSDLSVAEKNIGGWLSSHSAALTNAANVLKTVAAVVPIPAAQAISGVISGIEGLASQAQSVASQVTVATAAVQQPATLQPLINTVETDAFEGATAAAEAAFNDLMQGKPVATLEADALTAAEGVFIPKGTSN